MPHRTEEVFDWISNDYDSDKGDLLSENESEDDIWISDRPVTGDFDKLALPHPLPREGQEILRQ